MTGEARTGSNEGYFETHEMLSSDRRKRRRRANQYDPNASRADIAYQDNYGL